MGTSTTGTNGTASDLPGTLPNHALPEITASQAVNAYALAFGASPQECQLATSGLAIADKYLAALLAVYGADARQADEYVGIEGLRREIDDARRSPCRLSVSQQPETKTELSWTAIADPMSASVINAIESTTFPAPSIFAT